MRINIQVGSLKISNRPTIAQLHKRGIWVDSEGNETPIAKLESSHLVNIAKMLVRKAKLQKQQNDNFYCFCPEPNGDMAQIAFEQECDMVWDTEFDDYLVRNPVWKFIIQEIVKRKLLKHVFPGEEDMSYWELQGDANFWRDLPYYGSEAE